VGDVMYDAILQFSELSESRSTLLSALGISPKEYLLATIHRPANTDNPENLKAIFEAFRELDEMIIFPVHPRTRGKIAELIDNLEEFAPKLKLIEPVGYLDMLSLEKNASMIMTDSGGIQKEAYWLHVPCITLRDETEWIETVEVGWNTLVGANTKSIRSAVSSWTIPVDAPNFYGDGRAAGAIAHILGETFS
nr:UDP-N-acetylglucosamine 2-epimerase [Candidatus Brocadiales bacterium]